MLTTTITTSNHNNMFETTCQEITNQAYSYDRRSHSSQPSLPPPPPPTQPPLPRPAPTTSRRWKQRVQTDMNYKACSYKQLGDHHHQASQIKNRSNRDNVQTSHTFHARLERKKRRKKNLARMHAIVDPMNASTAKSI